jgi:hypothetical protein
MKDENFAKLYEAVGFLKRHGNSLRFETDTFKSPINEYDHQLQALIVTPFRIHSQNKKQFWCIRIGKVPADAVPVLFRWTTMSFFGGRPTLSVVVARGARGAIGDAARPSRFVLE